MNEMKPADILVIEDSKSDADLISYTFKRNRIKNRIRVIYDGEDAIRYLTAAAPYEDASVPDLILLDLNLPRINGLEILKFIKANDRIRHVPTIILTTSTSNEDTHEAYRNYANAYLTKPLDFERFAEVMAKLDDFWFNIVRLPKETDHTS